MARTNRPIRVLVEERYRMHEQVQDLILKQNDVTFIPAADEYDLILSSRAWRVVPGMEDLVIKEAIKGARRMRYGKKEPMLGAPIMEDFS